MGKCEIVPTQTELGYKHETDDICLNNNNAKRDECCYYPGARETPKRGNAEHKILSHMEVAPQSFQKLKLDGTGWILQ